MPPRPWLVALGLAACVHLIGMVRCDIPSQDGLAFMRLARDFQRQPWDIVVRDADQHPLYPAAIALSQPVVAAVIGPGSDSWRLAAQGISSLCAVLTLVPLYALSRNLFGDPIGFWACLLWIALPFPGAVGHDTLSDAPALVFVMLALASGQRAWSERRLTSALTCGLWAGLGFLVRPEAGIVPGVVALTALLDCAGRRIEPVGLRRSAGWLAGLLLPLVLTVLGYSAIKGTISTKLVWRGWSGSVVSQSVRPTRPLMPPGLDAAVWDFAPKEEVQEGLIRSLPQAVVELGHNWSAGLGWALVPLVALGWIRVRPITSTRLLSLFLLVEAVLLIVHGRRVGYLSARHALPMVLLSVPWAAAYVGLVGQRLQAWRGQATEPSGRWAVGMVTTALLVGLAVQIGWKPSHASRGGYREAGRWIAGVLEPGEAVLDTRGWAAFVAGCRAYDYWHVRQALTDARLGYVVVGSDELNADSRRAQTLRSILAYSGSLAATFPPPAGVPGHEVLVYRYQRPESWEGLTR